MSSDFSPQFRYMIFHIFTCINLKVSCQFVAHSFQAAFEALGVVAVITNCALIGLAAKSADWLPEMTPVNAVLMFVAIEVSTSF